MTIFIQFFKRHSTSIVLTSFFYLCMACLPKPTYATIISNDITSDTIWQLNNSPYTIHQEIAIQKDATLNIEPGVIIKFSGASAGLRVYGTVNAIGSVDQPIIFTSYQDDTYGGDTNNDGAAAQPASGNWHHIYFLAGSAANLDQTIIKYGGYYHDKTDYGMIKIFSAAVTVQNSQMSNSPIRLILIRANATITKNILTNPEGDYIISITGSSPIITHNTITNCGSIGIYAIGLDTLDTITLSAPYIGYNSISDCNYGIYASGTKEIIEHNIFNNNQYGIQIYSGYIRPESSTSTRNSTTIKNNQISHSSINGIYLYNVDEATIINNTINTSRIGIKVGLNTFATITNNNFYDNTSYAVYSLTSPILVLAEHNWWGNSSGPYHVIHNNTGQGDQVGYGVDFDPWLSEPIASSQSTTPTNSTGLRIQRQHWRKTAILRWKNLDNTNYVRIKRSGNDGSELTFTDKIIAEEYKDTTLNYTVTYTYTLYFIDEAGKTSTQKTSHSISLKNPTPHIIQLQANGSNLTANWYQPTNLRATKGYMVYYGTTADDLDHTINVGNVHTFTLNRFIAPNRYFVSIAAYNQAGLAGPTSKIQSIYLD